MALQLTPLAIALQGIGYGTFLTAVQGLALFDIGPPSSAPEAQGSHGRPRRRTRRIIPVRLPSEAVLPNEDEEELALQLLGML
jgi:hypothetical protein